MVEPGHHEVCVEGLPDWLDVERLLGPGTWELHGQGRRVCARGVLPRAQAADLQARLRGLGIGGAELEVDVRPPLSRPVVRRARAADAARRRQTTPGWSRPDARAEGEGRYSLTPEALAQRMAHAAAGRAVVDVCAGAGGNTVAFARAGCPVLAFEPDAERRAELRHNLRVYGVARQVEVRAQPLEAVVDSLAGDLLFADPPWGGDYDRRHCGVGSLPLLPVILGAARRFRDCWLKLPPSFDVSQIDHSGVEALFGEAEGDWRRVKCLWVRGAGALEAP